MRRDQLARRTLGHDLAGIHHGEAVAQLLGLVHVMSRDDQRDPVRLEAVEPVPEHVPRLRVEAGGRLVQQEDLGLVDQRPGDREPAPHSSGEHLDPGVGLVLELRERQQALEADADHRLLEAEVSAVDEDVLADRQLAVEAVVLWDNPDPPPDLRAVVPRIQPEHAQCPRGDGRGCTEHPHGRRLPGPVGTEKAKGHATPEFEVDAVDGVERRRAIPCRIRLLEAPGLDQEPAAGHATTVPKPTAACNNRTAERNFRSMLRAGWGSSLNRVGALLQPERLDSDVVLLGVAGVDPVHQRLQQRQQRGVGAHERGRIRRVVEADSRQPRDLRQGRVGDRQRHRVAVSGELHGPCDQRVWPSRRQADHERVLVNPAEPAERLLRRARDDLGAEIEQHQQVSQVARKERHLIGAGDQDLVGGDDRVDRSLDVRARQLVGGVLDVDVVGGQR